jgi:hypothetical protein
LFCDDEMNGQALIKRVPLFLTEETIAPAKAGCLHAFVNFSKILSISIRAAQRAIFMMLMSVECGTTSNNYH